MKTISISQWAAAAVKKARGVHAASSSKRPHVAGLIPTLSAVRELKRTEVRAPQPCANPNGIVSSSPGLRGTSYPGTTARMDINPNGVASSSPPPGRNPVGVDKSFGTRTQGSSFFATLGCMTKSLWDFQKTQHDLLPKTIIPFSLLAPVRFAILLVLGFTLTAFAQVNRTIGTLPPGGTVTITFDVTVNSPFPANTYSMTNQGSVSAGGIATILTDDPAVGGASDPTVTTVFVPPQITCPPNITTNAAGYCPPTIAFASTVTAGAPVPVVSYKIGTTNITSPYTFPLGTNIVTSTATNAAGTNTCNFTVIVAPGAAPQLLIQRTGTNVVVSWTNLFPCYTFQFAPVLASNSWSSYPGPFATNNGKIFVTNSAPFTNRFFRLKF